MIQHLLEEDDKQTKQAGTELCQAQVKLDQAAS